MKEEIKILARKIKERRKAFGLTQQELADLAGCGITFVNQLEMGKVTIRIDKFISVLKVLGLKFKVE